MDTKLRENLASKILGVLAQRVPNSIAVLRGSAARGETDRYSDIDVLWKVPDDHFADAVSQVGDTLSAVAPIESLRSDPGFQRSEKRRLFYIRFRNVPLFWRLDLDVFAQSVERDDAYDRTNLRARGSDWSPTESALMNVVAAIKAHYRDDDHRASELLRRGYERVGLKPRPESLRGEMLELIEGIRELDPETTPLVERIMLLISEVFPDVR